MGPLICKEDYLMNAKNKQITRKKAVFNPLMIWLGIAPGLLIFILFRLVPSIGTVIFSLTDIRQTPGNAVHFVGLENYMDIMTLNMRDFGNALIRTGIFTGLVTIVQTALALFIAVILNMKSIKGKTFYRTVVFLPVILGVTVCGLAFKLFFSVDGPAAWFLHLFGQSSTFFGDRNVALYLVIFCQIWFNVGSEMIIFLAGLQNVAPELIEAARIDGASDWKVFWHVSIPQIVSVVAVNLMMCLIGSLSAYQIILVTTKGNEWTKTLSMMIFGIAFNVGDAGKSNAGRQGYASALQVMLFLIILVVTLITQKIQNKVEEKEGIR